MVFSNPRSAQTYALNYIRRLMLRVVCTLDGLRFVRCPGISFKAKNALLRAKRFVCMCFRSCCGDKSSV